MFPQILDSQITYDSVIQNLYQVLYIGDNIRQQVCLLTGNPKPTISHHNVQRVTVKFLILLYLTRSLCVCNREGQGIPQNVR